MVKNSLGEEVNVEALNKVLNEGGGMAQVGANSPQTSYMGDANKQQEYLDRQVQAMYRAGLDPDANEYWKNVSSNMMDAAAADIFYRANSVYNNPEQARIDVVNNNGRYDINVNASDAWLKSDEGKQVMANLNQFKGVDMNANPEALKNIKEYAAKFNQYNENARQAANELYENNKTILENTSRLGRGFSFVNDPDMAKAAARAISGDVDTNLLTKDQMSKLQESGFHITKDGDDWMIKRADFEEGMKKLRASNSYGWNGTYGIKHISRDDLGKVYTNLTNARNAGADRFLSDDEKSILNTEYSAMKDVVDGKMSIEEFNRREDTFRNDSRYGRKGVEKIGDTVAKLMDYGDLTTKRGVLATLGQNAKDNTNADYLSNFLAGSSDNDYTGFVEDIGLGAGQLAKGVGGLLVDIPATLGLGAGELYLDTIGKLQETLNPEMKEENAAARKQLDDLAGYVNTSNSSATWSALDMVASSPFYAVTNSVPTIVSNSLGGDRSSKEDREFITNKLQSVIDQSAERSLGRGNSIFGFEITGEVGGNNMGAVVGAIIAAIPEVYAEIETLGMAGATLPKAGAAVINTSKDIFSAARLSQATRTARNLERLRNTEKTLRAAGNVAEAAKISDQIPKEVAHLTRTLRVLKQQETRAVQLGQALEKTFSADSRIINAMRAGDIADATAEYIKTVAQVSGANIKTANAAANIASRIKTLVTPTAARVTGEVLQGMTWTASDFITAGKPFDANEFVANAMVDAMFGGTLYAAGRLGNKASMSIETKKLYKQLLDQAEKETGGEINKTDILNKAQDMVRARRGLTLENITDVQDLGDKEVNKFLEMVIAKQQTDSQIENINKINVGANDGTNNIQEPNVGRVQAQDPNGNVETIDVNDLPENVAVVQPANGSMPRKIYIKEPEPQIELNTSSLSLDNMLPNVDFKYSINAQDIITKENITPPNKEIVDVDGKKMLKPTGKTIKPKIKDGVVEVAPVDPKVKAETDLAMVNMAKAQAVNIARTGEGNYGDPEKMWQDYLREELEKEDADDIYYELERSVMGVYTNIDDITAGEIIEKRYVVHKSSSFNYDKTTGDLTEDVRYYLVDLKNTTDINRGFYDNDNYREISEDVYNSFREKGILNDSEFIKKYNKEGRPLEEVYEDTVKDIITQKYNREYLEDILAEDGDFYIEIDDYIESIKNKEDVSYEDTVNSLENLAKDIIDEHTRSNGYENSEYDIEDIRNIIKETIESEKENISDVDTLEEPLGYKLLQKSKEIYDEKMAKIKTIKDTNLTASSSKAAGMQKAARDRLITGELTAAERGKFYDRYEKMFKGKDVIVNDKHAVVINPSVFGRVKVEFDDGTTKAVEPNDVKDKFTSREDIDMDIYNKFIKPEIERQLGVNIDEIINEMKNGKK